MWPFFNNSYDDAKTSFQEAIEIKEQIYGRYHLSTAGSYNWLAKTCYKEKEYDEAIKQYNIFCDIYKNIFGLQYKNTIEDQKKT